MLIGAVLHLGSLSFHGALWRCGSLPGFGALRAPGSLSLHGTPWRCGSLSSCGALRGGGSLGELGALGLRGYRIGQFGGP